jgi:CAAX prenyl protease-like protein
LAKAYVIPFVAYLVGTSLIARWGDAWYPLLYGMLVVGLVCGMAWGLPKSNCLQPHWRVGTGIAVGLIGIALWIVLAHLHVEQMLASYLPSWLRPETRVAYNPFEHLDGGAVWAFIAVRIVGIAVVVPLAEELFWRGFLLRWLIDPEWEKVPLGEFTLSSCCIVTFMFTLAHPEWLAAVSYALLLNGLLYWKRDLWLCVVAHAVSNLVLAIYVLLSGEWWLW